jgi:2-oxoisovalerate dehydrogenase E1 component alpha subunit
MVEKKTESIHVPDAPHRPGDETKFEQWSWKPEDLNRLDIECSVDDAINHATGLVRVLDDDHEAKGEWNPNLTSEELILGLEHMLRMRIFDERMMKMQAYREIIILHEIFWRRSNCDCSDHGSKGSRLVISYI